MAGLSSAKNKDVNQKSYNQDKEKEGIEKALDLMIDRKNFYEIELGKAADAEAKFSLKQKIEDVKKEIEEYREKLENM